jgi:ribosomal-protein-serine acetyltransferase
MYSLRVDDRIRLALPMDRHAAPVFELIDAERERLARWLTDLPRTVEEQKAQFRQRREALGPGSAYSFVIEVDGAPAGTLGLGCNPYGNPTAELGYLLASRYEGQGIVTRSLSTLIDVAIAELGIHRFQIRCVTGNQRSRAVPERLGFSHEGTLRDDALIGGILYDRELYALLAPDWSTGARG